MKTPQIHPMQNIPALREKAPLPGRRTSLSLKGERGQYLPIAMMVIFAVVVFTTAVVNVYKVAKAKLEAQNLADAIALNIASQQITGMFNVIADRNEWLNHLYSVSSSASNAWQNTGSTANTLVGKTFSTVAAAKAAQNALGNTPLPPISHVHNPNNDPRKFVFYSEGNARQYARLVRQINEIQKTFHRAHEAMLGAGNPQAGNQSLGAILSNDFPVLRDGKTQVTIWNDFNQEGDADQDFDRLQSQTRGRPWNARNDPLSFDPFKTNIRQMKFQTAPIKVAYLEVPRISLGGMGGGPRIAKLTKTLGQLAGNTSGDEVGWMYPAWDQMPGITNESASNAKKVGVGVQVIKQVSTFLGTQVVRGKAKAYVMRTGNMGEPANPNGQTIDNPIFKPTYSARLMK